jgi:hypothetical protein
MDTTTFPITFDRTSRIPMTVLGADPRVSRVNVSAEDQSGLAAALTPSTPHSLRPK